MMMSQQFTPGIIGGFPIDAVRTDLNRLYYGDVRMAETLGGSLPVFHQGLQGWQSPVYGATPWQTATPWMTPVAGATSPLPWALAQAYQWPYQQAAFQAPLQAGYPVGPLFQQPIHPALSQVAGLGYLPGSGHGYLPINGQIAPLGHGYQPIGGQGHLPIGQGFLPINGQPFQPLFGDVRMTDPRFVPDVRTIDPRYVDPRLATDPRFAGEFRTLEQRPWDLRPSFDPRIAVDPRFVTDPRLVADPRFAADPRFVADPRLAMVDPRSWMPSSTHLYSSLAPAVNTAETPDAHLLVIELPGVDVRDVTLQVAGNQLILTAFRKPIWNNGTVTVGYHATEGRFGTLRRVFHLPVGYPASQIQANFVNGQITIVLPKAAVPMGSGAPAANVAINAAIPATV